MLNKLVLFIAIGIMSLQVKAQMKTDTVLQKRQPAASEIQQLRIAADSIRQALLRRDTLSQKPANEVLMQYVLLHDYFLKSHEVIDFSQKHIKLVLGKADTTLVLSPINQIEMWQYGKFFQSRWSRAKSPLYRFYFQKGQLISVARLDD